MNSARWRRRALGLLVMGGSLFAGPCGITTLQLQDFLSSTLIRTSVSTIAQVVEAVVVSSAVNQNN